jgi:hypothetical protein
MGHNASMTLNKTLLSGNLPNAYVWHVCGYPWAVTNSPACKAWLDSGAANPIQMRKYLFGPIESLASSYASNDVVVLVSLEDVGSWTINYDEGKGLNCGEWSVKIGGQWNFKWPFHSAFSHFGLPGLDWQPSQYTTGSAWSVVGIDFEPDATSFECDLYWPIDRDFGLKAYVDSAHSGTALTYARYLWTSQSCLCPIGDVTESGDFYVVTCRACQFDTPRESVRASAEYQNVLVTNYPQGMAGNTARLFGLLFDSAGNFVE